MLHELSCGNPVFFACVAANTEGSPGTVGARMFVRRDGTQEGTIGGGAMELALLDHGRAALGGEPSRPTMETLWHRKTGPGLKSGMICSGSQTNVYLVCEPEASMEVVQQILEGYDRVPQVRLVIDAEGWRVEPEDGASGGTPIRLLQVDPDWRYEERLIHGRRIAIAGAGHCGKALSRTMHQLGFHVSVFDTRPDVETLLSNEWADEKMVVSRYEDVGSRITYPSLTRVVVMTSDYPSDVMALAGCLPLPLPFLGVMGSRAKINEIQAELRKRGFSPEQVDRLRAPIGLPIGSHTPEEIAISVAADILQQIHESGSRGGA